MGAMITNSKYMIPIQVYSVYESNMAGPYTNSTKTDLKQSGIDNTLNKRDSQQKCFHNLNCFSFKVFLLLIKHGGSEPE